MARHSYTGSQLRHFFSSYFFVSLLPNLSLSIRFSTLFKNIKAAGAIYRATLQLLGNLMSSEEKKKKKESFFSKTWAIRQAVVSGLLALFG